MRKEVTLAGPGVWRDVGVRGRVWGTGQELLLGQLERLWGSPRDRCLGKDDEFSWKHVDSKRPWGYGHLGLELWGALRVEVWMTSC